MSSNSSASRSSSQVSLSTEMGGPRVEVNAVRTGSQQQQAGSSKSAGIKTTISQAHLDYSIGVPPPKATPLDFNPGASTPRANLFVPNSPYAVYDPYNPYSPYNPYNPYIVYAPKPPCPKHGPQAPTPAVSPQSSDVSVSAEPAAAGTSTSSGPAATTSGAAATTSGPATTTSGPAPTTSGPAATRRPLMFEVNGKQIIVEEGFDIEEEYINDVLVSRTVNGVREVVPEKK